MMNKTLRCTKITRIAGMIGTLLAALTLSGCGILGSVMLPGSGGQKKALKAYQEFLQEKAPRNEIYGDMIFPDRSGRPVLAVLYVDDAMKGFDDPHFDLYGFNGGKIERIAAFDPKDEAREDGGEMLDIIFTDGIVRTYTYDGHYNPTITYYQIDGNELTPVYVSHYDENKHTFEVTIGSGKKAVEMVLETSDGFFDAIYPKEYDSAMKDLYENIYDGKYEWNDYAKYMTDEVPYVTAYSWPLAFLDDEGVYDFEGHSDEWYDQMTAGELSDFERDLSGYLIEEGWPQGTEFLVTLYNNSQVYRKYGSGGIYDFTTCIMARDPKLVDQIEYARSDEKEFEKAVAFYEDYFEN